MLTPLKIEEQKSPTLTLSEVGFVAFLFMVFVFVLFQANTNHGAVFGFSYWLIPDSITNFELTRGLVNGEFALSDFLAAPGVPLYFSIFFYSGILGFITANVLLLLIGIRYFGLRALYIPLLLYPYYLQLLVLPSKDMMVLGVYFAVLFYLIRGDWLKVFIISIGAYFIRDATPFLLLPLVGVAFLIRKTNIRPLWIVVAAFLCGMVAFASLELVAPNLFVVSRNLYIFQNASSEALQGLGTGALGYLARIFFNLTNGAFRLTFIDEGGFVSIESIFLYISGISSLVCCIIAARYVFKSKEKTIQLVSICYFVTLFIISINPFVQGRYQFPMSIVASIILFRQMRAQSLVRLYALVIIISLGARFIYGYMNIPFPPHMEYLGVDLLTLVH